MSGSVFMRKSNLYTLGFISIFNLSSAVGQDSRTNIDYGVFVDCGLLKEDQATSRFLGALDSKIHGYDKNLYALDSLSLEPYVKDAIKKNPTFPAGWLAKTFRKPYSEYRKAPDENSRINFLYEELERKHNLSKPQIQSLIARGCP